MKRRTEAAYEAAKIECEEIDAEAVADAKVRNILDIDGAIFDRLCVATDKRRKKRAQAARAWERCKRQAIEVAEGI